MQFFSVFLSVVFVLRNQAELIPNLLAEAAACISPLVSDYEFIIIDNASEDDSIAVLKSLTEENGEPNLQIYALTREVDTDTAIWAGLENALGDFVAVIDPLIDDIHFLPTMLDKAAGGADIVLATNQKTPNLNLIYRSAFTIFNLLYQLLHGIHLAKEAPNYRILNKTVINFILQHPQPVLTYRHIPSTGGFSRVNLNYSATPRKTQAKHLGDSIDRGIKMLVSTTHTPMRLVTTLSMFGAIANLVYSVYVVTVGLLKTNVAPGWISLSLQQSGMFFLLSLVLFVLGEYILQMARLSNQGPSYHIGQEFNSSRIIRREKLNIEESLPHAPYSSRFNTR